MRNLSSVSAVVETCRNGSRSTTKDIGSKKAFAQQGNPADILQPQLIFGLPELSIPAIPPLFSDQPKGFDMIFI
jgi:hypothetical protein